MLCLHSSKSIYFTHSQPEVHLSFFHQKNPDRYHTFSNPRLYLSCFPGKKINLNILKNHSSWISANAIKQNTIAFKTQSQVCISGIVFLFEKRTKSAFVNINMQMCCAVIGWSAHSAVYQTSKMRRHCSKRLLFPARSSDLFQSLFCKSVEVNGYK